MRKIKKSTESMQLSSLLHAPIFAPTNYKIEESTRTLVSYEVNRTKYERIVYSGLQLNAGDDFPLFAIIMSKFQRNNNTEVILTELEVFDALKLSATARNNLKRGVLERRLKRLEHCHVELFYYDDGIKYDLEGYSTRLSFPLFSRTLYDKKSGEIKVNVSRELGEMRSVDFQQDFIDLTVYYKIKTQYAKSVYLFLQTKKFKNQNTFNVHVDKFVERFGRSKMAYREKKRILNVALKQMRELGHIKDFEFKKEDRVDKVTITNVKRKK